MAPPLVPVIDMTTEPVAVAPARGASNPFFGDMFTTGSASGGSRSMNWMLHQYRAVAEAYHLTLHFLLLIFVEALHHMGWVSYNPFAGFAVPATAAGGATKPGYMPSWARDYPTFVTCWAGFLDQLQQRGGHKEMEGAMQGLQAVVVGIMGANVMDAGQWLVAAHVIMGRLHQLCVDLNIAKVGAPLTLAEERTATTRAKAVQPQTKGQAQQAAPASGGGGASSQQAGGGANRRRNRGPGGDQGGRNNRPRQGPPPRATGTDCPWHPGKGHTTFQCDNYTKLHRQQQQSQGQPPQQG